MADKPDHVPEGKFATVTRFIILHLTTQGLSKLSLSSVADPLARIRPGYTTSDITEDFAKACQG